MFLCTGVAVSLFLSVGLFHSSSSLKTQALPQVPKKSEVQVKFETLTPNLIVSDIERSIAFYRDVLGFQQGQTVPDKPPFVFVWMKQDGVNIFLNAPNPAAGESLAPWTGKPSHGTNTMYIKMHGIQELLSRVEKHGVKPVIAFHKEFYGMNEFAVSDPDGYLIILAEPAE